MPRTFGWGHAEDDLLLKYLHHSLLGGQFEGPGEGSIWGFVVENMSREGPLLGFVRKYTERSVRSRYFRRILPRLIHSPAQIQLSDAVSSRFPRQVLPRLSTFSAAQTPNANVSATDVGREDIPDGNADTAIPGDNYPDVLPTNQQLLKWADYVRDHPEEFTEAHEADELDDEEFDESAPVPEEGDDANSYARRTRYDLDTPGALRNWAEDLLAQNERNQQNRTDVQS
jgi:hypothetical protein